MRRLVTILLLLCSVQAFAQQFTGLSGLIHTPSAEMDSTGVARVGGHFINKHTTPDYGFTYQDEKYHTFDYYMSLTPFSWVSLGFTCTEKKRSYGEKVGYIGKDRYFSVKFQPLKEGLYRPAVAIGTNDFYTEAASDRKEESKEQYYFGNYYISLTKNFNLGGNSLGTTLSYRRFFRSYNSKWNGLVGGVTFRPSFAPQLRAVAEYSGCGVNVGADVLLWRILLIQVSLQDCKYFNGGLCLHLDLN